MALCSGFELTLVATRAPADGGDPAQSSTASFVLEVAQVERAGERFQPPRIVMSKTFEAIRDANGLTLRAPLEAAWTDPGDAGTLGHPCAEELRIVVREATRGRAQEPLLELDLAESQKGLRLVALRGSGWSATLENHALRAAGIGLMLSYTTSNSYVD